MNDLINKYINNSNQLKCVDNIVRIDGWEGNIDNSSTNKFEEEAADETINNYIKCKNIKENVNDIIYRDKYDEYGFAIDNE